MYYLCKTHGKAFRSIKGFIAHWNLNHHDQDRPPDEEVMSEEIPEGFKLGKSVTKTPAKKKLDVEEVEIPDQLPEDFLERVKLSLAVQRVSGSVSQQVVNTLKLHPEAHDNPNNFANLLLTILNSSIEGRRHVGKLSLIVQEVFGYSSQQGIPYLGNFVQQGMPYFPQPGSFMPSSMYGQPPPWPFSPPYSPPRDTELERRLKAIEEGLQGGGQGATMTIYDDKGNPMAEVPYDPSLVDTIKEKTKTEMEAIKTKQLIEQLGGGGSTDRLQQLLKPLEDKIEKAEKAAEAARKQLEDTRYTQLEERVKAAEEIAAAAGSEEKGILDFAAEGASEVKSGVQEAAKDIKEGIMHAGDKVAEVATGVRRQRPPGETKTPGEIAGIMETENEFLNKMEGR